MPQSDFKSTIIDEHEFKVYMLSPRVATDVLAELGTMLGPSFNAIASVEEDDEAGAISAMSAFFKNYTSEKGQFIITHLANRSSIDGKELKNKEVFDDVFAGKIGLMFKWLAFAVQAQYSDFFENMGVAFGSQTREH